MSINIKEIARWIGVLIPGGFGLWELGYAAVYSIAHLRRDWVGSCFLLVFSTVLWAPFIVVAYICLRRRYRDLFIVLGVVLAAFIWGLLSDLPDRLNVINYSLELMKGNPSWIVVFLPLSIVMLVGPFWAAYWVLRHFYRLARPLESSHSIPIPLLAKFHK